MTYKVVLDSNVFSPEGFPKLVASKFFSLARQKKVVPIYGDVFLTEIVHCYLINELRVQLLDEWLPFIFNSDGLFTRSLYEIRREELISGRGHKARCYMAPREVKIVRDNLLNFDRDGGSSNFVRTKEEKEQHARETKGYRAISLQARARMQEEINKKPQLKNHIPTFAQFNKSRVVNDLAQELLPILLDASQLIEPLDRWRRNRNQYPYCTKSIISHAYAQYVAMSDFNAHIDPNAQADLDLMLHLGSADILVSNETRYLKSAFNALWKPVGKMLFKPDEFFELIKSW